MTVDSSLREIKFNFKYDTEALLQSQEWQSFQTVRNTVGCRPQVCRHIIETDKVGIVINYTYTAKIVPAVDKDVRALLASATTNHSTLHTFGGFTTRLIFYIVSLNHD